MANPYDFFARRGLAASDGHQFIWDHAYFNGRYYCYFGVVPALLTFVPYQLITGHWMPTWVAMEYSPRSPSSSARCWCVALHTTIFRRLARRRMARDHRFQHRHESVRIQHELQLLWRAIVCAIALVLMGLWFWQVSKRHDGSVNGRLIGAGSLCMALLLGSRPQFAAAGCWHSRCSGSRLPTPHVVLQARRMGDGGRAAPVRARDGSAAVLQPYSLWCVA